MISLVKYTRERDAATASKYTYYVLMAVYAVTALVALPQYFPWSSVNFILGAIGLPLTIMANADKRVSFRFFPVTLLFVLLYFLLPERTLLFFAIVSAVICLYEQVWGRLSLLSLTTLTFMSTTVQYLAGIFSFPLRLSLTHFSGRLLNFTGTSTVTAGNLISFGNREFSVDPACMGIKTLLTSLLFGLFIIAIFQRQYARQIKWYWVFCSLAILFGLNLVSNIVRVLLLVYFGIMPENMLHEVTGLLCLVIYVLAPATWMIKTIVSKYGVPFDKFVKQGGNKVYIRKHVWLQAIPALLIFTAMTLNNSTAGRSVVSLFQVDGYKATYYDTDVLQYSNEHTLVYIKKIDNPLGAEHNPVMCWVGAGYQFRQVVESSIAGTTIYTGILKKGNELLYTAWWYDNGRNRTTSQLEWRWRNLQGEPKYSVINVTTGSEALLHQQLVEILGQRVFAGVL